MQMSYSEQRWMGGGEIKFLEIGVGVDLGILAHSYSYRLVLAASNTYLTKTEHEKSNFCGLDRP